MPATLTLIRGLPGSGKSTLAKSMDAMHLEADMYFINEHGVYIFDPQSIPKAHQWCLQRCQFYLNRNVDVVVANTFIKHWEIDKYRKLANQFNVKLSIRVCTGEYENIHQVPESTIQKMKRDWQD